MIENKKHLKTLKKMGIRYTTIRKHGVLIHVYEYKGRYYNTKNAVMNEFVKNN